MSKYLKTKLYINNSHLTNIIFLIVIKFSENNIVSTIQKFILHSKLNKVKTLRYVLPCWACCQNND